MPHFRKQPVIIEAYQFLPGSGPLLNAWLDSHGVDYHYNRGGKLVLPTLEGPMEASPKDWIIRGIKGEFYPCKPDIFEETYEEVEGPNG